MKRFGFHSSFKLKSAQDIARLYNHGRKIKRGRILLFWMIIEPQLGYSSNSSALSVAFGVPKRKHKRAVTRNRLKRLMREAFRLQEWPTKISSPSGRLLLFFQYVHEDTAHYHQIGDDMSELLIVLQERMSNI